MKTHMLRVTFACVVSLLLTTFAAAAADRVALVIGNGAYKFANALPNPVNDATDIGEKLKSLGFEVYGGNDLDLAGMQGAMRQFADHSPGAKVVLFFYAGHGMEVNGKNYLVPVDAKLETSTALAFEVVDANVVLNIMVEEKRIAVALLDACRDNPLARSFKKKSRSAVGSGLADVKVEQVGGGGLLYGLATGPGDTAADGEGRNSPFTKALLKHIGTPGVEFEQMMKSVKRDVDADTHGDQRPYLTSSLVDDLFMVPAAVSAPDQKAIADAPVVVPQGANTDAEWNLVKASKSVAVLEAFIAKHGDDAIYRGLAEERLAELKPPQADLKNAGEDVALNIPPEKPAVTSVAQLEEISPTPRVVELGKWPEGMAIGAENELWVAESGARQIVRVDLSTGKTVAKVPVGRLPVSMASAPDGTVYAGVFTDGKVWRQPVTKKGRSIWQLPSKAHVLIDIATGDNAVFAAHYTDAPDRITTVSRINDDGSVISSEPLASEGRSLVFDGEALWLLNGSGTLTKFNAANLQVMSSGDSDKFLWKLAANTTAVFAGGKTVQAAEGVSLVERYSLDNPNDRMTQVFQSNEFILAVAATEQRVAILGDGGGVWILDAASLRPLKHFNTGEAPRAAMFHNGQLYIDTHRGETGAMLIYDGLTE